MEVFSISLLNAIAESSHQLLHGSGRPESDSSGHRELLRFAWGSRQRQQDPVLDE